MGVYLTSAGDVVKGWIGDRGIAEGVGPCAIANAKEKEGDVWRDEWVSGGRRVWPERPVADRGRLTLLGKRSFRAPITYRPSSRKHKNVRGEIQQGCGNYTVPSQGWSREAHAGRSTLRAHPRFFLGLPILISPHPNPQFYSYYKQGVCCEAQSQVI
jgi:hypothetical protein